MPNKRMAGTSLLVEKLRVALQNRKGSYSDISRRTGIPESWLRAFSQGRVGEPGMARLEVLAIGLGFRVQLTGSALNAPRPDTEKSTLEARSRRMVQSAVFGHVTE